MCVRMDNDTIENFRVITAHLNKTTPELRAPIRNMDTYHRASLEMRKQLGI